MWIVCCGMKRSGSTLQYQLTSHLVESTGRGVRVGWSEKFTDTLAAHGQVQGWKVYKNHNYAPEIAAEFNAGRAKGIYIYRDLRDVFVSFMHKQDASFERLWQRDILREIVANDEKWMTLPDMLVSRYEVMMQDVPDEVTRIASHLGLHVTPEYAQSVADEYSVERQTERIGSFKDAQVLDHKIAFDKHSLLHDNHISEAKGQVSQWRTVLTPAQTALIEERYGAWLVAHNYALQGDDSRGQST